MGDGEEAIGPNSSAVRVLQGKLERAAIGCCAVFFAGQGGDGTDGTSGFTRDIGCLSMGGLVGLIFQDDNTETDVTHADEERHSGNTDKSEFPTVGQTDDGTTDESCNSLDDCTQSDTSKTVDLLRCIGQIRGQFTSRVALFIEPSNILTKNGTEAQRSKFTSQSGGTTSKRVILSGDSDSGSDGNQEKP